MRCEHCNKQIIKPIQESKEDYWKCICGDYHKGFPYMCPKKNIKKLICETWQNSSSYRDFKISLFNLLELK